MTTRTDLPFLSHLTPEQQKYLVYRAYVAYCRAENFPYAQTTPESYVATWAEVAEAVMQNDPLHTESGVLHMAATIVKRRRDPKPTWFGRYLIDVFIRTLERMAADA